MGKGDAESIFKIFLLLLLYGITQTMMRNQVTDLTHHVKGVGCEQCSSILAPHNTNSPVSSFKQFLFKQCVSAAQVHMLSSIFSPHYILHFLWRQVLVVRSTLKAEANIYLIGVIHSHFYFILLLCRRWAVDCLSSFVVWLMGAVEKYEGMEE